MHDESTALIPLRARDGAIRAYAIVDAADAAWVSQWRWSFDKDGYAISSTRAHAGRRRTMSLHRELLGLSPGDGWEIDHVNRDKLDNRRANLRIVPRGANSQNRRNRRGSRSSYRGVYWHKANQKWVAHATIGGRRAYLGCFTSETEAAEAARIARAQLLPYSVD